MQPSPTGRCSRPSQLCYQVAMGDNTKSLADIEADDIHCSPRTYPAGDAIIEGYEMAPRTRCSMAFPGTEVRLTACGFLDPPSYPFCRSAYCSHPAAPGPPPHPEGSSPFLDSPCSPRGPKRAVLEVRTVPKKALSISTSSAHLPLFHRVVQWRSQPRAGQHSMFPACCGAQSTGTALCWSYSSLPSAALTQRPSAAAGQRRSSAASRRSCSLVREHISSLGSG
ncbi:uncharacterized protein LOC101751112 isoform X3 [Gallus gallus]|uniref:uncharacterized protein LOC101751112 isoform X3 n=1 Tax=Gallus gallus TaxID=9031 RepID=UPI001EFFBC44|nr:uncharacterized protein LOC101751112 isoform X3 [Gallus gallus]